MKTKISAAAAATALLAISGGTIGQPLPEHYFKLGFANVGFHSAHLKETDSLPAVTMALGRRVNDWYSFEARVGAGISPASFDGAPTPVDAQAELHRLAGLYNKFAFINRRGFEPYMQVGYTLLPKKLRTIRLVLGRMIL